MCFLEVYYSLNIPLPYKERVGMNDASGVVAVSTAHSHTISYLAYKAKKMHEYEEQLKKELM